MRIKNILIGLIAVFLTIFSNGLILAAEPTKPNIDTVFDFEKETRIQALASRSLEEAFKQLNNADFLINEDFLHKAIFVAFRYRTEDAIAFVLKFFQKPVITLVDGNLVNRSEQFYIARKILQVFSEQSAKKILDVYSSSTVIAKSNIIQALGNLAGGEEINTLLVNALDDQTFYEEEYEEMEGQSLRICDAAYNQLMIRYQIAGALRTISPAHKIETRDEQIRFLKSRL